MIKPAIVTTTIESFYNLSRFINYHKAIGFEKFYIFVDFFPYSLERISGSFQTNDMVYTSTLLYDEDKTHSIRQERIALTDELNTIQGVHAILCDEAFHKEHYQNPINLNDRQRYNANYAASLAIEEKCTHLAHLDYDELVYCKTSTFLSEIKKINTVAYMQAWEAAAQTPHQELFESSLFRKKLSTQQQEKLELNEKTKRFKNAWYRGFKHYKSIYNLSFLYANNITIGLHTAVQNIPYEERSKPDLNILHFNCCNVDIFKSKWLLRNAHEPLWSYSLDQESKDESRAFLECKTEEEVVTLYNYYYSLTEEEKRLLFELDALVEIKLPGTMFQSMPLGATLRRRYLPKLKDTHIDLYPCIADYLEVNNVIIDPATGLVFNENFEPHKQTSLEYLWWVPPHFVTKDFKDILTRPVPRDIVDKSTARREAHLYEHIQKIKEIPITDLPDKEYVSLLTHHGRYAFGHIFDTLQKIFTLKQNGPLGENTHYLVSNHDHINDFSMYLDILSEKNNVPYTTLKPDGRLKFVKKCILIKPQQWPQNFADSSSYNFIYNAFCNYFKHHKPTEEKSRKLFLTRNPPVKRNILNFEELHKSLQEHDVDVVYGTESLADVFHYFNNATHICGYHGSLFSNHIFCKENTKILEYCAKNRPDGSISDKWRNTELYYQKYVEADAKHNTTLDIEEVLEFYKHNY